MTIRLLSILSFIFLLLACDDEQNEVKKSGKVKLSIGTLANATGRAQSDNLDKIKKIVVSIETAAGTSVHDLHTLELVRFNDSFVSEELELESGTYKVTKFFVTDEDKNVLYATPLENSDLASLVADPLPVSFVVNADGSTTEVFMEAVAVEEIAPEDFGYVSFALGLINWKFAIIDNKGFGGSQIDRMRDAIVTSDGGTLMVGITNSSDGDLYQPLGDFDASAWFLKLDATGEKQWSIQYSHSGTPKLDEATTVLELQNSPGNYIAYGSTNTGSQNINWLVKIDQNGVVTTVKEYSNFSVLDIAYSHQSNNYILLGSNGVREIETNGSIVWENSSIVGSQILTVPDGYIAVSSTAITKLNTTGQEVWSKANTIFGGGGVFVKAAVYNDVVTVIGSIPNQNTYHPFIKINGTNGLLLSQHTFSVIDYENSKQFNTLINDFKFMPNGNMLVVGGRINANDNIATINAWLIELTPQGLIIGRKSWTGSKDIYFTMIADRKGVSNTLTNNYHLVGELYSSVPNGPSFLGKTDVWSMKMKFY